jgi:hypothetical protein
MSLLDLQHSEQSMAYNPEILSEVINTVACIYRRKGLYENARIFLENGLKMERQHGLNTGTTALNLSGVLYSLNHIEKSLSCA